MKAYITRLAYYLPDIVEENEEARLRKKTGILRRHVCPEDMKAADMAVNAAEKLFDDSFACQKIDFLLYCTQSPDYPLPSTACILQDRLGLSKECLAFDVNMGCSGWVYGMSICGSFLSNGAVKKALLL